MTFTRDYGLLKEIEKRVNAWIQKANELLAESETSTSSDNFNEASLVESLEKLVNENLPLP